VLNKVDNNVELFLCLTKYQNTEVYVEWRYDSTNFNLRINLYCTAFKLVFVPLVRCLY